MCQGDRLTVWDLEKPSSVNLFMGSRLQVIRAEDEFSLFLILSSCGETFSRSSWGGRKMNEKENLPACLCVCVAPALTPDSHLALPLWFAKCSPTLSPPGYCCALCDCIVYVCVHVCICVWDEVLSNRWSNLIHVSFLPCCPLALMVCWWCYLGLTSILSALFLESAHPALPCPASPPPPSRKPRAPRLRHTLVLQEQLVRWSCSQVTWDRSLCGSWVKCVWKNSILFTVNEQMLLLL